MRRVLLLAFVMVPFMASFAQAAGNRCAMVAFTNNTDTTLHYQFKWGDGSWGSFVVEPGRVHWHSWKYDFINQNRSPVPYVRFDRDMSSAVEMVTFHLEAYASPTESYEGGKIYQFSLDDEGDLVLTGTN
jgi:hypothetical protein